MFQENKMSRVYQFTIAVGVILLTSTLVGCGSKDKDAEILRLQQASADKDKQIAAMQPHQLSGDALKQRVFSLVAKKVQEEDWRLDNPESDVRLTDVYDIKKSDSTMYPLDAVVHVEVSPYHPKPGDNSGYGMQMTYGVNIDTGKVGDRYK